MDIREAATDLLDFVTDVETDAFHALPHADRIGNRAVKNALIELGEAAKAIPEDVRQAISRSGLEGVRWPAGHDRPPVFRYRHKQAVADYQDRGTRTTRRGRKGAWRRPGPIATRPAMGAICQKWSDAIADVE